MDAPQELIDRNQWVVWRDEQGRKVPYQPSGAYARTNDPATWSTYEDCLAVADQYSGLGFVFSDSDPFCGIDLDNVYQDGEIADWAREIIEHLDTYAEISPSGRGVKLWFRGKIPDGKGRKAAVDGDNGHQGIEVYDRGRYFTFTGRRLFDQDAVADCQDALDTLLAHYWPAPAVQPSPAAVSLPAADVSERVLSYLEKIPPAISGQNGHGHTIETAAKIVRGFDLSPDQAYYLVQGWNSTCQPPWSEKELRHKLEDAAKRDGPRGWLLEREQESNGAPVDLSRLLSGSDDDDDEPEDDDIASDPGAFPTECLRPPGLISEIIDYNIKTAIYPQPILALAGALAVVGVVTGRKIRDRRDCRTNLQMLVLCPTGGGKDHARNIAKKLLAAAGCTDMIGPDRLTSHAGILRELERSPSCLFQPDEYHTTISSACNGRNSPHLKHIPEVIKEAYSAAVTEVWRPAGYGDKKFNIQINQPHMVLHAVGVGDEFWEACNQELVTGGSLGRMIFFEVTASETAVMPSEADATVSVPWLLAEKLRWWAALTGDGNLFEMNPTPRVIDETDAAKERRMEHWTAIRRRQQTERTLRSALWARAGQKAAQLALVFAVSRQTGQEEIIIDAADWNLAIKLNNWSTRKLVWHAETHLADGQYAKIVNKLLEAIPKEPGITRARWTSRTYRLTDRNTRQRVLQDLVEGGKVSIHEVKTATKPKEMLVRK